MSARIIGVPGYSPGGFGPTAWVAFGAKRLASFTGDAVLSGAALTVLLTVSSDGSGENPSRERGKTT